MSYIFERKLFNQFFKIMFSNQNLKDLRLPLLISRTLLLMLNYFGFEMLESTMKISIVQEL